MIRDKSRWKPPPNRRDAECAAEGFCRSYEQEFAPSLPIVAAIAHLIGWVTVLNLPRRAERPREGIPAIQTLRG